MHHYYYSVCICVCVWLYLSFIVKCNCSHIMYIQHESPKSLALHFFSNKILIHIYKYIHCHNKHWISLKKYHRDWLAKNLIDSFSSSYTILSLGSLKTSRIYWEMVRKHFFQYLNFLISIFKESKFCFIFFAILLTCSGFKGENIFLKVP